jgi:hypothetical protein
LGLLITEKRPELLPVLLMMRSQFAVLEAFQLVLELTLTESRPPGAGKVRLVGLTLRIAPDPMPFWVILTLKLVTPAPLKVSVPLRELVDVRG